jgi:hypothetical protein
MGNARAAISTITFARQILAGAEAPVLDQPVLNDAREIVDIGVGAVKLFLGVSILSGT